MTIPNYPSGHCHIQSFDSASTPEAFADREIELGTGTLVTTDHGTMGASRKVYDIAHKRGLTPILGCLLPGQEIHTIDGMKRVEDISPGDLVLTHLGRYRPVLRTMSRLYDGNAYTLYDARNGSRGLTVTGEHPVWICGQDKKPRWVKASEIVAGKNDRKWGSTRYGYRSHVLVPTLRAGRVRTIDVQKYLRPLGFWFSGRRTGEQYVHLGSCRWPMPRALPLSADLCYFLGLYAAEGWAQEDGSIGLAFNIEEKAFIRAVTDFLVGVGAHPKTYRRPEKGGAEVVACLKPWAILLRALCGVGAANKKIPREILCSQRHLREAFLRGLLDGDGKKGDRNDLKTPSLDLAWSARLLAFDLGAVSIPRQVPTYEDNHHAAYNLGLQEEAKWRRTFIVKDGGKTWRAMPLLEVKVSHYKGPVFNFEVDEDHSYVSDYTLHNCEAYFRDDEDPILRAHGIEDIKGYEKYFHLTMHCLDAEAFSFLSQKLSHARLEAHGSQKKPLFNWRDLEEIGAHNVTFFSGCLVGMVQRHILHDGLDLPVRFAIADAYYQRLRGIVRPGNFYAEVFPHRCDKNWVQGYFLDLENGERVRFWEKKKLRLEHLGEVTAAELARKFGTQAWKDGDRLVAVMNNRKWQDQDPVAIKKAEHVEDFFSNECQPWCPDGDVQLGCNRVIVQLARKYNDRTVVSDDSHFSTPAEKVVQDIRLGGMGNWKFHESYHRQSGEESYRYFHQYMGVNEARFGQWVDNNREWADRFKGFVFDSTPSLPTKFYPADTLAHTRTLIAKHGRMDDTNPAYVKRLEQEIELLHRNGTIDLLPYLFIDEEAVAHYQAHGELTGPGRGSAAGLLLAYLLGITHVDPLRYGLSLERFLTLDRIRSGKLPDVDQDLPHRDLLMGTLVPGFEVTLDDGSKKEVARDQRVSTDLGEMTVSEAFDRKLDVREWL